MYTYILEVDDVRANGKKYTFAVNPNVGESVVLYDEYYTIVGIVHEPSDGRDYKVFVKLESED